MQQTAKSSTDNNIIAPGWRADAEEGRLIKLPLDARQFRKYRKCVRLGTNHHRRLPRSTLINGRLMKHTLIHRHLNSLVSSFKWH